MNRLKIQLEQVLAKAKLQGKLAVCLTFERENVGRFAAVGIGLVDADHYQIPKVDPQSPASVVETAEFDPA